MSKILVLANHYNTLRIFRRELLIELASLGHELVVSIPETDNKNMELLESYGCRVIITPMDRRGINPLKDLALLFRYKRIIKREKPDKVITYTIKPNIYGSLVCKATNIPHFVNVTGLGSAFYKESMTKKIVSFLYKNSLKKANKIFFENVGNRDTLVNNHIIRLEQSVVMPGAGVSLEEFQFVEYPKNEEEIQFLFVGRIMREKGVEELFYTIQKIKAEYPKVSFGFLGWYEEEYKEKVDLLVSQNLIKYYGFQLDVKTYIEKAHCIILPSYHEGMSNTLLEGAAIGRPLITSDIHGCKEAVINGENGYLVKVKDSEDLYKKVKLFMELPYCEKASMGEKSRKHVEKRFNKRKVVQMTLSEIFENKLDSVYKCSRSVSNE